jgi:hypothetical protein
MCARLLRITPIAMDAAEGGHGPPTTRVHLRQDPITLASTGRRTGRCSCSHSAAPSSFFAPVARMCRVYITIYTCLTRVNLPPVSSSRTCSILGWILVFAGNALTVRGSQTRRRCCLPFTVAVVVGRSHGSKCKGLNESFSTHTVTGCGSRNSCHGGQDSTTAPSRITYTIVWSADSSMQPRIAVTATKQQRQPGSLQACNSGTGLNHTQRWMHHELMPVPPSAQRDCTGVACLPCSWASSVACRPSGSCCSTSSWIPLWLWPPAQDASTACSRQHAAHS